VFASVNASFSPIGSILLLSEILLPYRAIEMSASEFSPRGGGTCQRILQAKWGDPSDRGYGIQCNGRRTGGVQRGL